jgi:hypothetical protein
LGFEIEPGVLPLSHIPSVELGLVEPKQGVHEGKLARVPQAVRGVRFLSKPSIRPFRPLARPLPSPRAPQAAAPKQKSSVAASNIPIVVPRACDLARNFPTTFLLFFASSFASFFEQQGVDDAEPTTRLPTNSDAFSFTRHPSFFPTAHSPLESFPKPGALFKWQ